MIWCPDAADASTRRPRKRDRLKGELRALLTLTSLKSSDRRGLHRLYMFFLVAVDVLCVFVCVILGLSDS